MKTRVFGAAALCLLALAAPAAAADDESVWESGLDAAGQPSLLVGGSMFVDPAFARIDVYRCPGGAACEPLNTTPAGDAYPARGGGWRRVDVSGLIAGDVVEARFVNAAESVVKTERTTAWQGTATLKDAPAVQGQSAVGATVTVAPGTWTGGWASRQAWGNWASRDLVACRTAAGTDCAWLSNDKPLVLEARWEGWYLFAISGFESGHTNWVSAQIPPLYGAPRPDIVRDALRAASAPLGPVQPAAATPMAAPLPAPNVARRPTATLRARALRHNHRLSIGRVTCPVRCTVNLTVMGGGKTLRRKLTVTGTRALTIAPRRGKLKVRVVVDGKTVATGTTRAA